MSGNLTCHAKTCAHNNRGVCDAHNIHIAGANAMTCDGTSCSSFIEEGIKNSLSNVYNMNIGGEQYRETRSFNNSPDIRCDAASCEYNINGSCISNYVNIDGQGAYDETMTACQSFNRRY